MRPGSIDRVGDQECESATQSMDRPNVGEGEPKAETGSCLWSLTRRASRYLRSSSLMWLPPLGGGVRFPVEGLLCDLSNWSWTDDARRTANTTS